MILRLINHRPCSVSSIMSRSCSYAKYPSRMPSCPTRSNSFYYYSKTTKKGYSLCFSAAIDRATPLLCRAIGAKILGLSSTLPSNVKGKQLMKMNDVRYLTTRATSSSSLPIEVKDILQEGLESGLERKELDLSFR